MWSMKLQHEAPMFLKQYQFTFDKKKLCVVISFSSFITHYIENLHIDGLFYSSRGGLEGTKLCYTSNIFISTKMKILLLTRTYYLFIIL